MGWYEKEIDMGPRWYRLNPDHSISPGPSPEEEAFAEYSKWLYGVDDQGKVNRSVEVTDCADGGFVSTVFLGLDHSYPGVEGPVLFESMYFKHGHGTDQYRYQTWDEALAGHYLMVASHRGPKKT